MTIESTTTGQSVEVRIEPKSYYGNEERWRPDTIHHGEVVAFIHALAGNEGFIEERSRVVVQTAEGRFIFALPAQVTVHGSLAQTERVRAYTERYAEWLATQRESVAG